jgi:DamX protein
VRPSGLEEMSERARLLLSNLRSEAAFSNTGRVGIVLLVVALLGLIPIYYVYLDLTSTRSDTALSAARQPGRVPGPLPRPDPSSAQSAQQPPTARDPGVPPVSRDVAPQPEHGAELVGAAGDNAGTSAAAEEETRGPRIAGVRPISREPPDPRNTPSAMRNEVPVPEHRTAPDGGSALTKLQQNRSSENPSSTSAVARPTPIKPPAEGVPGAGPIGGPDPAGSAKAPAPDAASSAADDMDVVLQSRITATRDWLASTPDNTNTIQLMGVGTEDRLKADLKPLLNTLEADKIYVFRTMAKGKPWFTVAYGSYPDRRGAVQAVQTLPGSLAANQPFVRTVAGIRNEQKQYGVTQ